MIKLTVISKAVVLAVALTLVISGSSAQQLPEAGLKKAKEAERQLAANKPREAVAAYQAVDKEYPGHASVSLRLGQIHDTLNETGPALFYFRRYMTIAGDKAMEEARARTLAMEKQVGAADAAQKFAKERGEETTPISLPSPQIKRSLAKVNPDGSMVTLRGPQDLVTTGVPEFRAMSATPVPELEVPEDSSQVLPPQPVKTAGLKTSQPAAAPGDPALEQALQVSGPAGATPGAPDKPKGRFTPPPMTDEAAKPAETPSVELSTPQVTFSAPAQPPVETPVATVAKAPRKTAAQRKTVRSKFFATKPVNSIDAQLKIENKYPNSLMTFAAVPNRGGDPVNAIMTTGESRSINIAPGKYRVTVNVSDTNYAPVTLLSATYEVEFAAGTEYYRAFSPETAQ